MAGISEKIDAFFVKKLWKKDTGPSGKVKTLEMRAFRLLYIILKGVSEEQLILRAMSLVYTTLLSIVPLLAVSFSVLKAFGVHTRFLIFVYYFLEPLGQSGADISMKIIEFVENVKISVLGSIGLSTLIYTVLSMIQKIEGSLNFIWDIKGTRGFSQRFSNYMSILLIGPVLIFSAIGITATLMSSTVMKKLMAFHLFGIIFYIISRLMPYLLISAAFTVVYILLPNTRVRFRAALTGGIAAAVLWQTIGWFFTSFVAKSAQYSAIYSGFATLILFLIWLYWNFLTLLIGARVAFYTQNPHLLDVGGRVQRPGEQMKEKLALSIMFLIGRSFHTDGRHWTFASLTQRLGRHADPVREVLSILEDKGLLVPTHAEPPAYLPGKDIAAMTLNEIVSAVRTPGEDNHIPGRAASVAEVDDIMKDIETAVASSLNNRTLRDLVISTDTAGS